jgi:hypothetical protein
VEIIQKVLSDLDKARIIVHFSLKKNNKIEDFGIMKQYKIEPEIVE